MHKMTKCLLHLLLGTLVCACGKHEAIPSPDNRLMLQPVIKESIIHFSLIDSDGTTVFSTSTRASNVQKWSLTWITNTKILLKSSGIGDWIWEQLEDGSWKRIKPLRKLSPNGEFVLYTHWNSYKEKTVTLKLLKVEGDDPDNAHQVLHAISTTIVVPDLIDCARWEGNETFMLTAQDREYIWQRQTNGSWKLVNGPEELISWYWSILSGEDPRKYMRRVN